MANPGGKSTMLGHWRMVLRQAEEAARAGRYDEALVLASRPDVVDHHHAVRLRTKLALDLIARASRRGESDDVAGAIEDLDLAERQGAAPDTLAAARLSLADKVSAEVRGDLDAGEPARVVERVEQLARHKVGGPALRRTREIAEAWQAALDEARRGEFGRAHDQLDRAERLAAGIAKLALTDTRRDVETRQKAAAPRVEALYTALAAGKWSEVLTLAESVLEAIPEHPAARQARTRAWQQIGALSPSAAWPDRGTRIPQVALASGRTPAEPVSPPAEAAPITWLNANLRAPFVPQPQPQPQQHQPARPAAREGETGPKGRFLVWVDAVGGYLVCLDDQVILGRAGPDSHADVPLMGDLSRNHATLVRDGDGYVLRAHQPTFVNGRAVETTPLRDGDVIRLGSTVELEFQQPSPVSSTARLSIVSRHRLPLAVDGVLLMAETCIIDGSPQAHIPAPGLAQPVVLYRQGGALWCRATGGFEVDGRACAARAPLTLQSSILGDGFSFSLEALGTKSV
ncbi:FHA domain-containing protein [Singulisphaera sp. Ch08]|uniref:FHA domain-containing protein n=2 Tax=Singulisphaera TaxID=466152 RepID=A0AAU7C9C7_9BACT